MDDYNIISLQESTNEWVNRLISILLGPITDGIDTIFTEAITLCKQNQEDEKYLMTFQNILSQIPKWNEGIIQSEADRIKQTSNCDYLEDLISCVHIIQLKALTCIRVGQKQKTLDIDIPNINLFTHKIYIYLARKLYTYIYLYEQNIPPLDIQKNKREVELLIKESILEAIRESIPVTSILKAYLEETVENNVDIQLNNPIPSSEADSKIVANDIKNDVATLTSLESSTPDNSLTLDNTPLSSSINSESSMNTNLAKDNNKLVLEPTPAISFSNIDETKDAKNLVENVMAPKDIPRLEELSELNYQRRKLEELEDQDNMDISNSESIKIMDPVENIKLNIEELN